MNLATKWGALIGGVRNIERPKGYETVAEIAKAMNISRPRAAAILLEQVDAQKIHRIKGRNSNGRACWFYGVK